MTRKGGPSCTHLGQARSVKARTLGCEECLAQGARWVHLRQCMTCGHVGCCDSSEGKHATRHFEDSRHAIMRSFEDGESWGWCFEDKLMLAFEGDRPTVAARG